MATRFSSNPAESAKALHQARDLIDRHMTWSSTPEGQDFWRNVSHKLQERFTEARLQAEGKTSPTPTTATKQPELSEAERLAADLESRL